LGLIKGRAEQKFQFKETLSNSNRKVIEKNHKEEKEEKMDEEINKKINT
jgi:predicted Holliday junction resolvase-like endonuclease